MLRELARISSYNKSYFWTKQVLQVKNYYAVECSCLLSNNYLKHTSTTNQNSHFDWHEGDEWNDRIYTKKCFYTKPTLSAVLHYKVGPGPSPNMQPRATILFCYFSDQLICVQKGGGDSHRSPTLDPLPPEEGKNLDFFTLMSDLLGKCTKLSQAEPSWQPTILRFFKLDDHFSYHFHTEIFSDDEPKASDQKTLHNQQ